MLRKKNEKTNNLYWQYQKAAGQQVRNTHAAEAVGVWQQYFARCHLISAHTHSHSHTHRLLVRSGRHYYQRGLGEPPKRCRHTTPLALCGVTRGASPRAHYSQPKETSLTPLII